MNATEAVRLYTIPEVAAKLRASSDTVYRLIEDKSLRFVDIGRDGRSRKRIRDDDLQKFIDARTN